MFTALTFVRHLKSGWRSWDTVLNDREGDDIQEFGYIICYVLCLLFLPQRSSEESKSGH